MPSTEAALLLAFWVQRSFLRLQIGYQPLGSVDGRWVGNKGHNALVFRNPVIDLYALLAHWLFLTSKKTDQRPVSSIE
jgi:hypothetical protein